MLDAVTTEKSPGQWTVLLSWVRRGMRIALALMGWALFFYWWTLIFQNTSPQAQWISLRGLIPVVIAVPTGAWLWVRHNKQLAARGRRGLISWYMPPIFQQDYFGRALEFADDLSIHVTQDIVLVVQEGQKIYSAATSKAVVRNLPNDRKNRSSRGSTPLPDPRPAAAA